ncbi:FAST kinase domain-containing protein 2, mitochondrial [Dicentrarchus labrax]|uniref:FAST kinase domain-containing protein 2, mitochondrial n=1 Tax=Dicentrarchus labrax TaxID=13489 RepID=UPI0021F50AC4|nr:FAST kinase domain-containing protein 2, mitochondrial [Dicentrarchus labrax]
MSFRAAEEIMRRGMRFCCRRSLWQQRSFLTTTSSRDTSFHSQHLAHFVVTRQSLAGSQVSSVKFYSQERIHSEDLDVKEQLLESLLPAEIRSDETASRQTQERSPLHDQLLQFGSPSEVLDFTIQNVPTAEQISKTLTYMWSTIKKMSTDQQRYELQLMFEHPAFESLLQLVRKNVGEMSSDNKPYSLLAMVKLGVPQNSLVVQTFLQACQAELNYFSEKSLAILACCLRDMEETPNVAALKKGVALVVEIRLPGIKSVVALQTIMQMLGKDAPHNLKKKLGKKALSMSNQFNLPNVQYMICIMATMEYCSKPLMAICCTKIRENIPVIPFWRLLAVLQSCTKLHYRDMNLFTDVSEHVAFTIDMWTNKQLVLFLTEFDRNFFCPAALMEAFAKKVIASPESLTRYVLLVVVRVYSSLNYDLQHQRQQFLDSLTQALESYLTKMSGFELLKAVYGLCVMGHYPSTLLEQLLQSSTLEQFETTAPKFRHYQEFMFQVVNLCLRLERPPLPQPLTVPPSALGAAPNNSPVNLNLLQGLQSLLLEHADMTLQEMVLVENFYLIDGLITRPLPHQTSATEAGSHAGDERSPAESSQRIAVICTRYTGFCHGTSNPRGHLAVKIRHLKILGYDPVLVSEQKLQSVSEEEMTEFLRGLIFPEHESPDTQPKMEQLES